MQLPSFSFILLAITLTSAAPINREEVQSTGTRDGTLVARSPEPGRWSMLKPPHPGHGMTDMIRHHLQQQQQQTASTKRDVGVEAHLGSLVARSPEPRRWPIAKPGPIHIPWHGGIDMHQFHQQQQQQTTANKRDVGAGSHLGSLVARTPEPEPEPSSILNRWHQNLQGLAHSFHPHQQRDLGAQPQPGALVTRSPEPRRFPIPTIGQIHHPGHGMIDMIHHHLHQQQQPSSSRRDLGAEAHLGSLVSRSPEPEPWKFFNGDQMHHLSQSMLNVMHHQQQQQQSSKRDIGAESQGV